MQVRTRMGALVAAAALGATPLLWTARAQGALPPFDVEITSATRLLVIAPHPDDEALGTAGLMARVRARGGTVQLALLTSGDAFPEAVEAAEGIRRPTAADFRTFGTLREGETRAALALLGVPANRISFLGFPDEGLCVLASRYLFDKRGRYESPYTDRTRPPVGEAIVRGARYRGVDVRLELERVITSFRPTLIAVVHPEDEHPDHCSTHIFTREALRAVAIARPMNPRIVHYLVHWGQWPLDRDPPSGQLQPPVGFPANEGRWVSMALTPEEAALKSEAVLRYRSQTQIIGRFMRGFLTSNELYLIGEPASLPECWCDGENVATETEPSRYRRRP